MNQKRGYTPPMSPAEGRTDGHRTQAQADARGGGEPDAPLTTAERKELAQLRCQACQITQERDIVAKATVRFYRSRPASV